MKYKNLDITNWTLEKLIKFYYPRIKEIVHLKSYKMRIDYSDLLSSVNYSLGKAVINNRFSGEHEKQFISWIDTLIFNTAINFKREQNREKPYLSDIDLEEYDIDHLTKNQTSQTCSSQKIFLKNVTEWAQQKYKDKKNNSFIEIFNRVLIDGDKYEEVATQLQINVNSLKTIIYTIRRDMNNKFGSEYTEIINN